MRHKDRATALISHLYHLFSELLVYPLSPMKAVFEKGLVLLAKLKKWSLFVTGGPIEVVVLDSSRFGTSLQLTKRERK